ncbi:MAG: YggS family pyridoxal phosphate-dependent enzyme [Hyphomicrobiales bacterium]|nr:YggS family pyridoxal phosphate-dependent enzyme [Hyphomicrobiales bacterium]
MAAEICDMTASYAAVRSAVEAAAVAAGRSPHSARLIAVTKTYEADAILPVIEAGQQLFGENRVQEAMRKWPPLRERFPDIELHLIGPLQSNKAREAVALFDVIHTVDRPKIAEALAAEMARQGRTPRLLVQVNTGEEPQKAGVAPGEAEAFVAQCRVLGLNIDGLMCIPPVEDDPAPHFRLLADLRARLGLAALSMGMSADFPAAIAAGATYVRVGSAIFGARPPA